MSERLPENLAEVTKKISLEPEIVERMKHDLFLDAQYKKTSPENARFVAISILKDSAGSNVKITETDALNPLKAKLMPILNYGIALYKSQINLLQRKIEKAKLPINALNNHKQELEIYIVKREAQYEIEKFDYERKSEALKRLVEERKRALLYRFYREGSTRDKAIVKQIEEAQKNLKSLPNEERFCYFARVVDKTENKIFEGDLRTLIEKYEKTIDKLEEVELDELEKKLDATKDYVKELEDQYKNQKEK